MRTAWKWLPYNRTDHLRLLAAATGGTSPYSSETVEPYLNLLYGWTPTEKLTIAAARAISAAASGFAPRRRGTFERYHQSLLAFYSVAETNHSLS